MEPHVYVWSWSGELLETETLAEFAANYDIEPRRHLAELQIAQAVIGRDPQSLVLAGGTGDILLTLTRDFGPSRCTE